MMLWACLPMVAFLVLVVIERKTSAKYASSGEVSSTGNFSRADWVMNLMGFFMQGVIVPALGYFVATAVLPKLLPAGAGSLHIGFWGAFILNIVFVDLLYYFQHRAFHEIPFLWKFHAPHHYSPVVNVWATSRNALITNLLFVYMLANPVLGYLCDVPIGFFAGAMITASLDLFRHANIRWHIPVLEGIVVLPQNHHRHHDGSKPSANYAANFLVWDRLFGTCDSTAEKPQSYSYPDPPSYTTQLLFPWRS